MTKENFAKQLYDTVDNGKWMGDSKEAILENIENLLTTVQPTDRDKFAFWGQANEVSTPKDCWPL